MNDTYADTYANTYANTTAMVFSTSDGQGNSLTMVNTIDDGYFVAHEVCGMFIGFARAIIPDVQVFVYVADEDRAIEPCRITRSE